MAENMTLYALADLRDALDAMLIESEGELTPEIAAELDRLDIATDEKIERVALYIREQLAQAEAIKAEADRLASRAAARKKAADSLKQYLGEQMTRLGKEKVNGLLVTVAMQQNKPSVVGEADAEALWNHGDANWAGFVRYTPASYAIDKKVVLDAHKQGLRIPNGLRVERTKSLRIR